MWVTIRTPVEDVPPSTPRSFRQSLVMGMVIPLLLMVASGTSATVA